MGCDGAGGWFLLAHSSQAHQLAGQASLARACQGSRPPRQRPADQSKLCRRCQAPLRRHTARRAAEEGKGDAQVVREFSEADGKVTEPASKDGNFYNDERPVRGRCERVCVEVEQRGQKGVAQAMCGRVLSGRARHPARAVQLQNYIVRDRSVSAS